MIVTFCLPDSPCFQFLVLLNGSVVLRRGEKDYALRVQVPDNHILTQNLYTLTTITQVPNYWVLGPSGTHLGAKCIQDRRRTNLVHASNSKN